MSTFVENFSYFAHIHASNIFFLNMAVPSFSEIVFVLIADLFFLSL
jgi:hypothetical protein